jgi:hypothetical protein
MSQHNWVKEKQGTKEVKGMKATEAFLFSHPVFSWSEWKKEVGGWSKRKDFAQPIVLLPEAGEIEEGG